MGHTVDPNHSPLPRGAGHAPPRTLALLTTAAVVANGVPPAGAATTAAPFTLRLAASCLGCGGYVPTGSFACAGPCLVDGEFCGTCESAAWANVFGPAVGCQATGTAYGEIDLVSGTAGYTLLWVGGGFTMDVPFASGARATATGTFTTAPPATSCAALVDVTLTGTMAGS